MNRKHVINIGLCFAAAIFASSQLAVRADDIDEKQKALEAKINEAAIAKQLSEKDARTVRKEMATFNKKKNHLRNLNSDKLSLQQDAELDKELNSVSQSFEKKKKPGS